VLYTIVLYTIVRDTYSVGSLEIANLTHCTSYLEFQTMEKVSKPSVSESAGFMNLGVNGNRCPKSIRNRIWVWDKNPVGSGLVPLAGHGNEPSR
jgi:hypothetical protein